MKEERKRQGDLNRREFLKGIAITGGTAAFAGLAGCAPTESTPSGNSSSPVTSTSLHTWETKPEPITDVIETKSFDIIIVGAGTGGNAAAEAAAREGAKVAVIEQASEFSANGMDCASIGAKWSLEHGQTFINPEDAARMLHRWSMMTTNRDLIYVWASRSGKVFDHLVELAEADGLVVTSAVSPTSKVGWDTLPEEWRVYTDSCSFVNPNDADTLWTDAGKACNWNIMNTLVNAALANGAEYFYNSRARQLIGDATTGITGVIVENEDGTYTQYNASKGVILATGDIGGNPEMVKAFAPLCERIDLNCYTTPNGNLGDGLLMGLWAGAAHSRSSAAPIVHPVDDYFTLSAFYMGWPTVNRNGRRYGPEMPYEPYITNARMVQPGNIGWNIFDSDYAVWVQKQYPNKYEKLLTTAADILAERLADGSMKQADTLEELAGLIEVPVDTFLSTMERYNQMSVADDDVDFGVKPQFLSEVRIPPFYANKVNAIEPCLLFGLHVDVNSQVCTDEDEPIPGLFAIGNMQGDFVGYTYPVICSGLSCGRALTFGQLVAEALAHDTILSKTA